MAQYRRPHRVRKKKSIFKNKFFWLGILMLGIFCGAFYLFCFSSIFQIKTIDIAGNYASVLTDTDKQQILFSEIQKIVDEKINQKILSLGIPFQDSEKWLLSRSIFLVNFDEIKKEIFKRFPQVEDLNFKKALPATIALQVTTREPVAVFCSILQGQALGDREMNCFFVDKNAIIFEPLTLDAIGDDKIILKKAVDQEISLGEKVINEEQLSKILETVKKLKNELTISVEETLIVSEKGFNVKTSEGFQVYFNSQENLDWQLIKLKADLEKEIPPERRKDLEYIDVRFGNFAPYKYREQPID